MEKVVLKATDGNIYIGQLAYSMSNSGDIPMKVERIKIPQNSLLNETIKDYIGDNPVQYTGFVTFTKSNIIWYYKETVK